MAKFLRALTSDVGSMLPVMIGAALLFCSIAFAALNASGLAAFRQNLQFVADQSALSAANLQSSDSAEVLSHAKQVLSEPSETLDIKIEQGQATIHLCACWQPPVSVLWSIPAQTVCVVSDAR